jgi:hypothetical protein
MLNWMKEIATNCLPDNDLDGDDFHLGFDVVIPSEMQDLLLSKKGLHSTVAVSNHLKKSQFRLDEHELAMG